MKLKYTKRPKEIEIEIQWEIEEVEIEIDTKTCCCYLRSPDLHFLTLLVSFSVNLQSSVILYWRKTSVIQSSVI